MYLCLLCISFYTHSMYKPWFPAYSWERAYSSTVDLVATSGSHYLKVQCLVKLSELFRQEAKFECDLTISRDEPTEYRQPAEQ